MRLKFDNANFWENSNLQPFKVINLVGANRKHIRNFLLVVNSNFGRISYCFRYIDTKPENTMFIPPCLIWSNQK